MIVVRSGSTRICIISIPIWIKFYDGQSTTDPLKSVARSYPFIFSVNENVLFKGKLESKISWLDPED